MGLRQRILLPALVSLFSIFPASSCNSPPTTPPPPPPVVNRAPDTEIIHSFGEYGTITYTFSGRDTDGSISRISVKINSLASRDVGLNSSLEVSIIEGANRAEATAHDNEDLADPTPAVYSFVSPTETQARDLISRILGERASTYRRLERDVLLSLGAIENFYVDFLATTNDGTDAVICYVGHTENSGVQRANSEYLSLIGVPNRYFFRLPEIEITSRLTTFINNGFR